MTYLTHCTPRPDLSGYPNTYAYTLEVPALADTVTVIVACDPDGPLYVEDLLLPDGTPVPAPVEALLPPDAELLRLAAQLIQHDRDQAAADAAERTWP